MSEKSVVVKVPATIGNFGGAENRAALALDASFNVKARLREDGEVSIRYFGENGERVPRDRTNLAARGMEAALHFAGMEFSGADLEIFSSVPVAVGLGSSTAAVLAGIMAADRLYSLSLDEKNILELAAIYESRADNLQAAWLGGFVTCGSEGWLSGARCALAPLDFSITVVAPEAQLETRGAENSVMAASGYEEQSAARALALAAFFAKTGKRNWPRLGAPLPPTCRKQIPGLDEALRTGHPGALMTFVCGSGPAVAVLAEDDSEFAVQSVRDCFAKAGVQTTFGTFRPANAGARDWNLVPAEAAGPFLVSPRAKTEPRVH